MFTQEGGKLWIEWITTLENLQVQMLRLYFRTTYAHLSENMLVALGAPSPPPISKGWLQAPPPPPTQSKFFTSHYFIGTDTLHSKQKRDKSRG